MSLPPSRFWDDAGFESIAEEHPELASRQEVFWLRLTEALRARREADALTLVNLSRYGRRSWSIELESALPRMLTFRRLGFMDPSIRRASGDAQIEGARHPFFETLEQWARGTVKDPPEAFKRLLRSDSAFAAAYLAEGWSEAGLALLGASRFQGEWPDWFLRDVAKALHACRGDAKAREFMKEHGVSGG
jgi:hypothetical protein